MNVLPSPGTRLASGVVFLLLLVVLPTTAQARNIQLGGVVGPNFSQLNGPDDPRGEVTVLAGTAFTGAGVSTGLTAAMKLFDVPHGALFAELDALYSYQRGTGFAESRTTEARRELTLISNMLRVPILARYDIVDDPLSIRFGLGLELLQGLSTNHSTLVTGTDPPATREAFDTTTTTHVGLATKIGLTYELAGLRIPIDLRFTWDPMVAASTRDRFVGYEGFDAPGQYRVAWNHQLLVVFGVEFDLTGKPDGATRSPTSGRRRAAM